jgi:hypothetical protein
VPSVSVVQQEKMGAAYARKKAGNPLPSDPKMTLAQLKEFASTSREGLPYRSPNSKKKSRRKIAEMRSGAQ